jgi:hypothetical protein
MGLWCKINFIFGYFVFFILVALIGTQRFINVFTGVQFFNNLNNPKTAANNMLLYQFTLHSFLPDYHDSC